MGASLLAITALVGSREMPSASVAQMSGAISAVFHPTCRCAHAGYMLAGKCLRCPDIFMSHPLVICKDHLNGHTGAEFAQDQFYGNARVANDGLAVRDFGFDARVTLS